MMPRLRTWNKSDPAVKCMEETQNNWASGGIGVVHYTPYQSQGFIGDELHRRDRDGKYRQGGPFDLEKIETYRVVSERREGYKNHFSSAYRWRGEFYANDIGVMSTAAMNERLSSLNPAHYAAKAYNRAKPARPNFSAALSLYELKDTPGMLRDLVRDFRSLVKKEARKQGLRKKVSRTAQWHLAVQLGWLPLLGDIQKLIETQRNAQKILTQLIRDEGRKIRRRVEILNTEEFATATYVRATALPNPMAGTKYSLGGDTVVTHRTKKRVWAEGQFRYYLPGGPKDIRWKKKMLRRIFGFRITPDLIYNAIPWTWLIDYFTNLGDLVDAVSSGVEDRLYCDYFYVMSTVEVTQQNMSWLTYMAGPPSGGNPTGPKENVYATTTRIASKKRRYEGNTFGFALESELSARQASIVGALGLSRLASPR